MNPQPQPTPDLFFDTLTAYQKTAALKSAIDLNLFTVLAEGPLTAVDIAARCNAAVRGIRILCDYMTVLGFLKKGGQPISPDTGQLGFSQSQIPRLSRRRNGIFVVRPSHPGFQTSHEGGLQRRHGGNATGQHRARTSDVADICPCHGWSHVSRSRRAGRVDATGFQKSHQSSRYFGESWSLGHCFRPEKPKDSPRRP